MNRFRPKIKSDKHITHEDLNEVYGEKGVTRKTHAAAVGLQKEYGGRITPIVDYWPSEVIAETMDFISDKGKRMETTRVYIKRNAKPHTVGYLVSSI